MKEIKMALTFENVTMEYSLSMVLNYTNTEL